MKAPHCVHWERDLGTKKSWARRRFVRVLECLRLGFAMISLLVGFRFFYDDWGSMIAISFTIASDFVAIHTAMRAESFAFLAA